MFFYICIFTKNKNKEYVVRSNIKKQRIEEEKDMSNIK